MVTITRDGETATSCVCCYCIVSKYMRVSNSLGCKWSSGLGLTVTRPHQLHRGGWEGGTCMYMYNIHVRVCVCHSHAPQDDWPSAITITQIRQCSSSCVHVHVLNMLLYISSDDATTCAYTCTCICTSLDRCSTYMYISVTHTLLEVPMQGSQL